MKATIVSTDRVVNLLKIEGSDVEARVWEGVTDTDVKFTAYIALVQVHKGADNSQFERDLREHKAPDMDTIRAIDARFIL